MLSHGIAGARHGACEYHVSIHETYIALFQSTDFVASRQINERKRHKKECSFLKKRTKKLLLPVPHPRMWP
jgi:hypothetical protein